MATPVTPPRGMRDFLPAEKARRERMLATIRSVYYAHGFDEIETPVMEDASRLHAGLGGDNEKLAFGVLKRGLSPEDLAAASDPLDLTDLGLRFDLTVPLTRFYASHQAELPKVFRSIQIAPVWRAERPQRGRFRQFIQCDIDIIGEASVLAEIELITATAATLTALGLEGCRIRINDRRVLRALVTHFGIPDDSYERALVTIDKEDKVGITGVVDELSQLGLGNAALIESVLRANAELPDDGWSLLANAPAWLDDSARAAYLELDGIREAVGDAATLVFAPGLVRGMGYYTGTIFEIEHPDLPYSLGGGGRYDGMIGRFLGTDVPAAGFSIGFERLVELVADNAGGDTDAVALIYDDVPTATLLALKNELIALGSRVRLERKPRNLKPLLAELSTSGFHRIATVDGDVRTLSDLRFRAID